MLIAKISSFWLIPYILNILTYIYLVVIVLDKLYNEIMLFQSKSIVSSDNYEISVGGYDQAPILVSNVSEVCVNV